MSALRLKMKLLLPSAAFAFVRRSSSLACTRRQRRLAIARSCWRELPPPSSFNWSSSARNLFCPTTRGGEGKRRKKKNGRGASRAPLLLLLHAAAAMATAAAAAAAKAAAAIAQLPPLTLSFSLLLLFVDFVFFFSYTHNAHSPPPSLLFPSFPLSLPSSLPPSSLHFFFSAYSIPE